MLRPSLSCLNFLSVIICPWESWQPGKETGIWEPKQPPHFPSHPSLIKYGAVSTKSVGGGGCVGKTQLPNVLVNIHKNTSVLLNPRQTITTQPCTLCILLLLILLSALNSFPQLLLPPSCVSELLPATLAFHASLWYPFQSSGPCCQLGCE